MLNVAECQVSMVMTKFIMLKVIMLAVVMLSIIMLNVVAPSDQSFLSDRSKTERKKFPERESREY
jgi:hypothetical protein